MAKSVDNAESAAVLLRTTADVVSHALTQLEVCAGVWSEYKGATADFRVMVERMVENAKDYGYIEKRGKV